MGDSGITLQLSLLAVLLVGTGIVAFVAACRVRNGMVRAVAGVLLFAIAVLSSMLSIMATLVLGALGFVALALAVKTPRGKGPRSESHRIDK
jgi:hypothetical protein